MKGSKHLRKSPVPFLLALGLVALLSVGCGRETQESQAGTKETEPMAEEGAVGPGSQHRDMGQSTATPADGRMESPGVQLTTMARANIDVDIGEAAPRRIEQVLRVPAVVKTEPDRVVLVSSPVEARIEQFHVKVGDVVEAGAPLLIVYSLEAERLQIELLRAVQSLAIADLSYERAIDLAEKAVLTELENLQKELLQSHSELILADAIVERLQQLSDKVVARKELEAAEVDYRIAQGTHQAVERKLQTYGMTPAQTRLILEGGLSRPILENLGVEPEEAGRLFLPLGNAAELYALEAELRERQAEVDSLKRQLQAVGFSSSDIAAVLQRTTPSATLTLRAPIAGTVIVRQGTPGTAVGPSERLVEVVDTSVVWVEGDLAEARLALVEIGQPGRVRVSAYPEEVFAGTVRAVGRSVEPEKRTVHFWLEVENPQGRLLPEMFADVALVVQAADEVLAVPLEAVVADGAGKFVFREEGGTYVRQEVLLGAKDDRYIEVRDGLSPGDRVVVRGAYELLSADSAAAEPAEGGEGHVDVVPH